MNHESSIFVMLLEKEKTSSMDTGKIFLILFPAQTRLSQGKHGFCF